VPVGDPVGGCVGVGSGVLVSSGSGVASVDGVAVAPAIVCAGSMIAVWLPLPLWAILALGVGSTAAATADPRTIRNIASAATERSAAISRQCPGVAVAFTTRVRAASWIHLMVRRSECQCAD